MRAPAARTVQWPEHAITNAVKTPLRLLDPGTPLVRFATALVRGVGPSEFDVRDARNNHPQYEGPEGVACR